MVERVDRINEVVKNIPDVKVVEIFQQVESDIIGRISVFVSGLFEPIEFDVVIKPQYPFRSHNTETIKFSNSELLKYRHVMRNASICISTPHSPNLAVKLKYDVESVKVWITRYVINGEFDLHYEHLIVGSSMVHGRHFVYLFNEVDYDFERNNYGFVDYSKISDGVFYSEDITSFILQKFYNQAKELLVNVNWNSKLKELQTFKGVYFFLDEEPTSNGRWVFDTWDEFSQKLPQEFLEFLHLCERSNLGNSDKSLPLFIGYRIPGGDIHWQAINLQVGSFPLSGYKVNKKWQTKINGSQTIHWAMTRNCSYKYFFGRGRMCDRVVNGNILLIGIGAVGSIVAKTLVRGGCRKVDFIDYDLKEPENVCRSEYSFISGVSDKTNDLVEEMYRISPFYQTKESTYRYSHLFDYFIKSQFSHFETRRDLEQKLNSYDIIFDCTADNDLLYVLTKLRIDSLCINISLSNHARQLVCAVENNRYEFVTTVFNGNVLKFDLEDLYQPTGCWSPTFKASYNDIDVLVQVSLKHINSKLSKDSDLGNFIIETDHSENFEISIREY